MKVTALLLFLILLIVLVVSVIVGKSVWKEGFISYQQSNKSTQSNPYALTIPTYSNKPVTKLFDNLYFDTGNGNLIEIDSPKYVTGGSVDLIGNTITSTTITPRSNFGNSRTYNGNVSLTQSNTAESGYTLSSSYSTFVYNSKSVNTDKYCVMYIPWNTNTYIHILDTTNNTHVGTYGTTNNVLNIYNWPTDPATGVPSQSTGLSNPSTDIDPNNNGFVSDNYYDPNKVLYQLSKYVKYDITNGCLIVQTQNTPKAVTIYNRLNPITSVNVTSPNTISNTPSTVQSITFSPNIIQDILGNNVVLYIPDGTNTLVAIISNKVNTGYTLANAVRFTANAVDTGSGSNANGLMTLFNTFISGGGGQVGSGSSGAQQRGQNGGNNGGQPTASGYSDDYILKTQIVPPVCPSCPSCSNNKGVCTNCGGQGGSGTKSGNGGTMVSGEKGKQGIVDNLTDEHSFFGEGTPTTGKKDANGNDIEWKSDIGKGTFSSNADPNTLAGGLSLMQYSTVAGIEELGYTAADVLKTGASTVGGAVKDVTGGIGKAAEGVGSGLKGAAHEAVDLAKSAGSGTVGLIKDKRDRDSAAPGQGSGGMGSQVPQGSGGMGSQGSGGPGSGGPGSGGPGAQGPSGSTGRGTPGYSQISSAGPQTMDQYSYYGTLPAKGSSIYMPVTADFSTFRH